MRYARNFLDQGPDSGFISDSHASRNWHVLCPSRGDLPFRFQGGRLRHRLGHSCDEVDIQLDHMGAKSCASLNCPASGLPFCKGVQELLPYSFCPPLHPLHAAPSDIQYADTVFVATERRNGDFGLGSLVT